MLNKLPTGFGNLTPEYILNDQMSEDSRVLLIFVDGLGIGAVSEENPLASYPRPFPLAWFTKFEDPTVSDHIMVRTDPRLGVEGRPQSASGQTTIRTGKNAPKLIGAHKQGFPNRALRGILSEYSIFRILREHGIEQLSFANAYTPRFFESAPRWKSATTCAVEAAGIRLLCLSDLRRGFAVFHDFTNASLQILGYDVDLISTKTAARNLAEITKRHRFTMYEHFITDKIGHMQDIEYAKRHLSALAEFVSRTVELLDLEKTTVILTSDHGNIEDLSVRTHTLNDVPTVLWGHNKERVASDICDLTHIAPAILKILTK